MIASVSMRALLAALALGLALSGCGRVREAVGLTKQPPDEFNVVTRAPLAMPPSLDVLPPPQPGAARPQELQPAEQAQAALFGTVLPVEEAASGGEQALLADAQAGVAEPDIRETVDAEHMALLEDSQGWVEYLQFWRDFPDPSAVVIDPAKERARLQGNAALGLPANEGDFEAVIVEEREKAIFEDLFQ